MGFSCLSWCQVSALPEGQLQNPWDAPGSHQPKHKGVSGWNWCSGSSWQTPAELREGIKGSGLRCQHVPGCPGCPLLKGHSGALLCSDKAREVEGDCPCGQDSSDSRSQREFRESLLPPAAACVWQAGVILGLAAAAALPGSRDGGTACLADPVECPSDSITSTATGERPARDGSVLSCAHIAAMSSHLTPSETLRSRNVCSGGGMLSSWNAGSFQDLREVSCVPRIKLNLIFGSKFAF